jgi:hypothetical protein
VSTQQNEVKGVVATFSAVTVEQSEGASDPLVQLN